MPNDVVLNKVQIIERCLQRVSDEYGGMPTSLQNVTQQDAIVLNIQRACEAAIDLAMHIVAERGLGLPQTSRDSFAFLAKQGLIDEQLAKQMQAMVGFRNIAVHEYQTINLAVLQAIVEKHLPDLRSFGSAMLRL